MISNVWCLKAYNLMPVESTLLRAIWKPTKLHAMSGPVGPVEHQAPPCCLIAQRGATPLRLPGNMKNMLKLLGKPFLSDPSTSFNNDLQGAFPLSFRLVSIPLGTARKIATLRRFGKPARPNIFWGKSWISGTNPHTKCFKKVTIRWCKSSSSLLTSPTWCGFSGQTQNAKIENTM